MASRLGQGTGNPGKLALRYPKGFGGSSPLDRTISGKNSPNLRGAWRRQLLALDRALSAHPEAFPQETLQHFAGAAFRQICL